MAKKAKNKVVIRPKPAKKKQPKADVTAVGRALRMLGGLGGTYLGGPTGAGIGTSLGAALSKWLGSGDYTVSNNSVVQKAASSIPVMHNSGQTVVVRHKEMLCEVVGSNAYTVQRSFVLNPGLVQTFPWLSRIAGCFQEYTIKGMVFHYIPTSGTYNAASPALGSVLLQTSYRSSDSPPASKVELLNEYCANESVPSEPFAHPIECDPKENPFNVQYVRSGNLPVGETQLMYDLGTTHLATSGCPSSAVLGDLWVTYEVELRKPILDSNVTASSGWSASYVTTSPTAPAVFPPLATTTSIGNVPLVLQNSTITLPVGYFGYFTFILSALQTSNASTTMAGSPTVSNCTVVNVSDASTDGRFDFNLAVVSGVSNLTYCVRVYKPNRDVAATVVLPSLTGAGISKTTLVMLGFTD